MRKITKEEALKLHRDMWSAMRDEYGNNPSPRNRSEFKERYIRQLGFEDVYFDCFLCEYANQQGRWCSACPIDWSDLSTLGTIRLGTIRATCIDTYNGNGYGSIYNTAPISEILVLPEKE